MQDFTEKYSYWTLKQESPGEWYLCDNTLSSEPARVASRVKLPAELCAGGSPTLIEPLLWAKCPIKRGVCNRFVSQVLGELKIRIEGRFESRPITLKECDGGPETPQKKKGSPGGSSEKPDGRKSEVMQTPERNSRRRKRQRGSPGSPSSQHTSPRRRLQFSQKSQDSKDESKATPKKKSKPSESGQSSRPFQKPGEHKEHEEQHALDDEEAAELEEEEEDLPEGNGAFQI